MSELKIVTDKEKVDVKLLMLTDPSLPQVMGYLNRCNAFVALLDDKAVAACLVDTKEGIYDIVNLSVDEGYQRQGIGKEMLRYVMDFARAQGVRYVDIGCGNAYGHLFMLYQKLGFRVIGVTPDYFLSDNKVPLVENSVVNRDLISFRADLQDNFFQTVGHQ